MLQKFLNNQWRVVMFDTIHHTVNSVVYRNDIQQKWPVLFQANQWLVDQLLATDALRHITPVTTH